jgi:hypothetical protein
LQLVDAFLLVSYKAEELRLKSKNRESNFLVSNPATPERRAILEYAANYPKASARALKNFSVFFPANVRADLLYEDVHIVVSNVFPLGVSGWPAGVANRPSGNKHDAIATIRSEISDIFEESYEQVQGVSLRNIKDALRQLEDDIRDDRLRRCANPKCKHPYFILRKAAGPQGGGRKYHSAECYREMRSTAEVKSKRNASKRRSWHKNHKRWDMNRKKKKTQG